MIEYRFDLHIYYTVAAVDSHIQRIVLAPEKTTVTRPTTLIDRDPNRDKTLARSNQPRKSETYRCQDVFRHELQFLLSGVCVCVVMPFILDVRLVDVPAGVTQEKGHTGFLHLPSAVLALVFSRERFSRSFTSSTVK